MLLIQELLIGDFQLWFMLTSLHHLHCYLVRLLNNKIAYLYSLRVWWSPLLIHFGLKLSQCLWSEHEILWDDLKTHIMSTMSSNFSKRIFEQIGPLYMEFRPFVEALTPWLLQSYDKLTFSLRMPLPEKLCHFKLCPCTSNSNSYIKEYKTWV